jgi:hypothetical protein
MKRLKKKHGAMNCSHVYQALPKAIRPGKGETTMSKSNFLYVLIGVLAVANVSSAQSRRPVGASPGAAESVAMIGQTCPTFSWGASPGASHYQLAVFSLRNEAEKGEEAAPVIDTAVPGSALSWTPPLKQCLESGGEYAWFVRAVDEYGEGEWSEGLYFEVASMPSPEEVEAALRVLRRYVAQSAGAGEESIEPPSERSTPIYRRSDGEPAKDTEDGTASGEISDKGISTAKFAIRGEISDITGETVGTIGISHSPAGAGLAGANTRGGQDLLLDGSLNLPPVTDTTISESGIDRASVNAETFDIGNSGTGTMTLTVDGVEVVMPSDLSTPVLYQSDSSYASSSDYAESPECPAGYKLTGGSCFCLSGSDFDRPVKYSRANVYINPTKWACKCENSSDDAWVKAHCIKLEP